MKGPMKKLISLIILAFASLLFTSQAVFATSELEVTLSTDRIYMSLMPDQFEMEGQTITISTDNIAGYQVKLATTGASSALVDVSDNTKTIPTFTLPNEATSIPVSSIGEGYGYSVDNGTNFYPVPEPLATPAALFSTNTAGENEHTLTFGVNVPADASAGTYTNTFNIIVIANIMPCQADSICYNGNGDDGTGLMSNQPADSNSEIMLLASNFSRSGYGFAGWNTEPDGTGTNYGPNQAITTGDLSVTGLQLYARWIPSSGNLQGWTGCAGMTAISYGNNGELIVAANSITALTDTRDNNTYAVVKFADDQCWMIENLRLDLSNQNLFISNENTNKPSADFVTAVNTNHPASSNSFCANNNATCNNQVKYNTNNTNRNLTAAYDTNNNSSSWYSYGHYYNWYTATAGNGTYGLNEAGASADGDICPADWRLPTGYSSSGDLAALDVTMGGDGTNKTSGTQAGLAASKRWRTYPYNYILSGEYRNDAGYNRGTSSSYATSTTASAANTNNLWLKPDGVHMNSNGTAKVRGQTVRCLYNPGAHIIGNIHYDANEGTGVVADETNVDFSTAVAANNAFTKANSLFTGWNTAADGSGVVVNEGESVAAAAESMNITTGQTLTLYATWRIQYSLVYDGNGSDAGVMTSANVSDLEPGQKTLVSPNFSRAGYGFVGWSLDDDASSKLTSGQAVTIYGPNQTIAINDDFYANADQEYQITLYAVWLPADSNYTMQSFSGAQCDNMEFGELIALRDIRDNNVYTVSKLEDGNCWMTENLRLDPSTTTFSSSNTNSPTAEFIADAPNSASSNTLCNDDEDTCIDTIRFNANALNRNLTPSYSHNSVNYSWYSYGVMYNWYTATAGNGTYDIDSTDAAGDICPANWRLPTGGEDGEFENLNDLANDGSLATDAGLMKFPDNFIYSGDFNYNIPGGRNNYGRFWSATPNGNLNAYRLGTVASGATPTGSYNKWDAFAVRCIYPGVFPVQLEYILDYDADSYSVTIPEDETANSRNSSYEFTISTETIPSLNGYTFLGYSDTSGSTTPDYVYNAVSGTFTPSTITINSSGQSTTKTIYAVFEEDICSAGYICYFDNGADGGVGTMANQSAVSNSTVTLIPPNYSKTGYGFAGWTTEDGNTVYGPNATISTGDLSSEGLKLYAKWIQSSGNLQGWTGCNSMVQNDVIALTDTRDNQTYAVAKLGDEKCWIVENLRLDPGTATITAQNTNNPVAGFVEASNDSDTHSLNTLCNVRGTDCLDQIQYNANNLNRTLTQSYTNDDALSGWYSYGVYYNWYTATAGNGTFSTTEQSGPNHDGVLSGDICPADWHLPTGGSGGEYNALNAVINNNSSSSDVVWRAYPNNFVWSGDYNNNKRNSSYSNGRIWTATTKNNDNAYRLGYAVGVLQASANTYEKWDGFAVRCVFNGATTYNNVTVSIPQNVSKVTFSSIIYGTTTATRTNNIVSLAKGATYTITASIASGYKLNTWTRGTNGALGNSAQNPTTFVITGDTTLALSVTQDTSYTGLEPPVSCNTPVPNITYMQEINTSNYTTVLDSLVDEQPYYLRDSRDDEPYCVSKLADGRLWMLDNLRLDLGDSDTLDNVTASNTNATAEQLNYLKNGGGTASDQYPTAPLNNVAWTSSGQDYYSVPMSVSSGTCMYSGSCVNENNSQWTKDSTVPVYGNGSGKVGVLYNYCAVSAGTYCYGNGTSKTNIPETDLKPDSLYDIDGDICPANWRLPTGTMPGDLYSLYNYYSYRDASSPNSLQYKTSIPFVGNFVSGKFHSDPTYQGGIWTATRGNSSNPQEFIIKQDTITMSNSLTHNYGIAARCILETPVHTVTVNFAGSGVSSVTISHSAYGSQTVTTSGDTVTLKHGISYTVTTTMSGAGYRFVEYTTSSNGTMEFNTYNPATYAVTGDSTLTATGEELSTYITAVNLDSHTNSVTLASSDHGTTTITNNGNNGDGTHTENVTIYSGITYTLTADIEIGYLFDTWSTTGGGAVASTTDNPTTFEANDASTLSIASHIIPIPTACNTPVPNITYMQDITSGNYNTVLNSLVPEQTYYLKDARDGEPYCVSKLADGGLWMLDNLRLDLGDSRILNNITDLNTNSSETALNYMKNGGASQSDKYATLRVNYRDWSKSYAHNYMSGAMSISAGPCFGADCVGNSDFENWTKDSTATSYGGGTGKIGIFYNYCAASGGTYCPGKDESVGSSPAQDPKPDTLYDIDGDICPAGWHLPTGNSGGEYSDLINAYNGTYDATDPSSVQHNLSTPLTGRFVGGSHSSENNYHGTRGYFWTSTHSSASEMRAFWVNSSSANLSDSVNRGYGLPVRCKLNS